MRAKAGKTTLFYELAKKHFKGDLSKALIIAFEKGYKALNGAMVQDINNWSEFTELVDQLVEHRDQVPFKWIALDTLDVMYTYAVEHVVKRERIARKDNKIKSISDIPWGGGYQLTDEEIKKTIDKLQGAGYGLFYITHEVDKKMTSRDGTEYDKTTVSLPTRARNTFVNSADFILFIDIVKEKEGGKMVDNRYIHFRSDGDVEAGSRFKNVPDKIEYDADIFLETFRDAVLSSFDGNEKAMDEAMSEQEIQREESAKDFVEQEKSKASTEDLVAKLGDMIGEMDKDKQAELKAKFKSEFKSVNYKKFTDEQLAKALEIAESI